MPKARFEVSDEGMRLLNEGRPPWSLVKELVQNAWDEAPEATVCNVSILPDTTPTGRHRKGRSIIRVEDDGSGFANIADAYTLMGDTAKRGNPNKRGRFNLGEKEMVSVAISAKISTVGKDVVFPERRVGGRKVADNDRTRGTVVELVMPWDEKERDEIVNMLLKFRPPSDCRLRVNDVEVVRNEPSEVHECTLDTVIQDGLGAPLRPTRRKTSIEIHEQLVDAETAWLFEMGIPIQPTELAYDVDVQQKVPMPPKRDTVRQSYLQDISAETLNAMADEMEGSDFGATWVRDALEDDRTEPSTVKRTVDQRYGDKVTFWSSNRDANMKATEQGYEVLHGRSMSKAEREAIKEHGGVRTANDLFGRMDFGIAPTSVEPDDVKRDFADWVRGLARVCGIIPSVVFNHHETNVVATCSGAGRRPTLSFNTYHLGDEWFAKREWPQFELVVHELGHAVADTPMEHGPSWGNACAEVAGKISASLY